ncbi:MAG: metallophosphoesterase [Lachnospiraceae bacterium]|nr:metallophosphoesterase [Lachnospiraceae bacterium]
MSKVLVIPDIHLKPWIFDQAEEALINTDCEFAVFIGDLVDDWNCEKNTKLYEETLQRAIDFVRKFPETVWCWGNHDLSYLWDQYDHPGYSLSAADMVVDMFEELSDSLGSPEQIGIIHRIDNTLFSHAGLSNEFVESGLSDMMDDIDCMIDIINGYGVEELWEDNSPIWVRPQYGTLAKGMYDHGLFQVVGHTPVREVLLQGNVLTVDVFSTASTGMKIGNEELVWVDTGTGDWGYTE